MTDIRLFTKPGCPYCVDAREWLQQHGCPFEVLEITQNVQVLREWRELSGGVGVPVLAHGKRLGHRVQSGALQGVSHIVSPDDNRRWVRDRGADAGAGARHLTRKCSRQEHRGGQSGLLWDGGARPAVWA